MSTNQPMQLPSDERTCLVGQLETWPLADMLLWLEQSHRSALLRIGAGLDAAVLLVRGGTLQRVEWGAIAGEDALIALLQLTAAPFNLMLREPPDARANVRGATPELLLRCSVAYDERRNVALRA